MKKTLSERFHHSYSPDPNSGCWLWDKCIAGFGHGQINIGKNKKVQAHRFAYELYVGPIPEGMLVRHKCDVPCCVNPDHLLLGTHADNVRDRCERNRSALGTKNGRAKLDDATVWTIINVQRLIGFSPKLMAQNYQVDQKVIRNIQSRESWRHIDPDSKPPF